MSVLVNVIGANELSDEYQAALNIKKIIQETVPQSVIGEIILFASANLIGQEVKDVDLFMLGNLMNYALRLDFTNMDDELVHDEIEICSFCTTIEIKSHGTEGIFRKGTDFYVKYGLNNHCVTEQSMKQKTAAINFFKRLLSFSPYITNLIWFTEITRHNLNEFLKADSKEMPANVYSKEFTFADIMQLLVWQRRPYKSGKKYNFDSNYGNCSVTDLQKALDFFSRTKETMGELTRQRIEQISRNSLNTDLLIPKEGKMPICRGKAGTGKTVGLIQVAIKLVDEEYARVLMLTYNKALVSEIRRLFSLAELPDLFEEKCVHISTMHSYYFRLINKSLYDGNLEGKYFIENYEKLLQEMIDFLETDESAIECVREIISSDCYLNWDYVLVDEAQDWTENEKKLLIYMFETSHIVVADGGRQFVRNVDVCDWSTIKSRDNIKLKYCLRQKNNLVKFINHFYEEYTNESNKITAGDKMPGGKVIIVSDQTKFFDVQKEEIDKFKKSGNIAYDLLYLTPSIYAKNEGTHRFSLINSFEKHDIFLWDGTSEEVREQFDEARVLQYESARGLEGWTVCCLGFDKFLENKIQEFDGDNSMRLLQSKEESLRNYLENWISISFTRAIDTLIICIEDTDSEIGKTLKKVADNNLDYVSWI